METNGFQFCAIANLDKTQIHLSETHAVEVESSVAAPSRLIQFKTSARHFKRNLSLLNRIVRPGTVMSKAQAGSINPIRVRLAKAGAPDQPARQELEWRGAGGGAAGAAGL